MDNIIESKFFHTEIKFHSQIEISYEVDWFDFETRMRKLIQEMLEPTIKKVNQDRDKIFRI